MPESANQIDGVRTPAAAKAGLAAAPSEQDVYRQIRDAIQSAAFKPGDRLPPERKLVEHFGATRNFVRRAILQLEREGLVSRHVGRGTFVLDADADLRPATAAPGITYSPVDILEARMVIEPGFADLIVARCTEEDFAKLEVALIRLEKAPTQQEFREAGYELHLELARVTRNPMLIRIFEMIIEARKAAGWRRLRALNETPEQRQSQAAANRSIVDALRDRDALVARRLIRTHFGQMVASITFETSE